MNFNYSLLTGAGYSKNFGGWLAGELWAVIFSHELVQQNQELKDIIWDYRDKGFEAIFDDERLRKKKEYSSYFQTIVKDSFVKMHRAVPKNRSDFNGEVNDFIYRFNSAFTLNQDIFFEAFHPIINEQSLKYFYPHVMSRSYLQYNCAQDLRNARQQDITNLNNLQFNANLILDNVPYDNSTNALSFLSKNAQIRKPLPYYKLHGSLNFIAATGAVRDESPFDVSPWGDNKDILVMGSSKPEQIDKIPLLKKYHEDFEETLKKTKKLMIIGYSFADYHINKKIFDAVEKSGLKFWIVDTAPLKNLIENAAAVYLKNDRPELDIRNCGSGNKWRTEVNNLFKRGLISISNCSLHDIFNKNHIELDRIYENFFN